MTKPKPKAAPKTPAKKLPTVENLSAALIQAQARIAQLEKMLAKLRLTKIKVAAKAKARLETPPSAILGDEDEL